MRGPSAACQLAYKVAQVPKKLMSGGGGGGGDSDTFPTSKFLPRFCRHIVGVPFVHHKPLTSKKIWAWDISISAWERENVVKCVRLTLNAWELAALHSLLLPLNYGITCLLNSCHHLHWITLETAKTAFVLDISCTDFIFMLIIFVCIFNSFYVFLSYKALCYIDIMKRS